LTRDSDVHKLKMLNRLVFVQVYSGVCLNAAYLAQPQGLVWQLLSH